MHELSIAQSIISLAESAIPKDNPGSITAVKLQVGELSGIEIDPLQFSFNIIKENTKLKNAELVIEIIPGEALCNECGKSFHLNSFGNGCPSCKSFKLIITKGKEMKVVNISVEH